MLEDDDRPQLSRPDRWTGPLLPTGLREFRVHLRTLDPPLRDGSPWWPAVATRAWLAEAGRHGFDAQDCTSEVLDFARDADAGYGGSVSIDGRVVDLWVDRSGCVQVAPEYHYCF